MASKGGSQGRVLLEPRLIAEGGGPVLSIDVANRSTEAITIVALPRYLTVELEGVNRQFVRGAPQAGATLGLPSPTDYRLVAANSVERGVFLLPVTPSEPGYLIGAVQFPAVEKKTTLRVSYKADAIIPNVPKASQKTLFRGPAESGKTPIELP